jgi:hypothetical protein
MATTSNFGLLLAGRFILGFAVALSAIAECIYIAEISTPEKRGLCLFVFAEDTVLVVTLLTFETFTHFDFGIGQLIENNQWSSFVDSSHPQSLPFPFAGFSIVQFATCLMESAMPAMGIKPRLDMN